MAASIVTTGVRNFALIGHGHVGKTTLAEHLLFRSGMTSRRGSVDAGTCLLDSDDEERDHRLTITTKAAHFQIGDLRFNLVDTPGYPDFLGQVIGALRAVELAVVCIDAHRGIEVNTRRVWNLAAEAGLPRLIVLTKCEDETLDFEALINDIRTTFGPECAPLNVPVYREGRLAGVASVLEPGLPADGVLVDPGEFTALLLDAAVESDDALMEQYLEAGSLAPDQVRAAIEGGLATGTLVPIVCTSARCEAGLDELLEILSTYAPAPWSLEREVVDAAGSAHWIDQSESAPVLAQVFKTRIDAFVSKLSYLRLYSGTLTKDDVLVDSRTGKTIRIQQLLDVQGNSSQPIDTARAGDIVAVAKLEDLLVGDTLTTPAERSQLPPLNFPRPMVGLAVEPRTRADQQKISLALHRLEDEDPTFVVSRDDQTHEMVMHGMSDLHLSIVEERLRHRDRVEIRTHAPRIPYRETILEVAEGSFRHKKQSGGAGQFAEVHLRIMPLPGWVEADDYFTRQRFPHCRHVHHDRELNVAFVDSVTGGSVPNQFVPAVERGVREAAASGSLVGCQAQDLCVELFFGKDHPVDSNEAAFRTAAKRCFRQVFSQARPVLLEPILHVEVYVPDTYLGEVVSDLNSRRGRIEGMSAEPGRYHIVRAHVPQAEMMTYSRTLLSITGGQGSFTLEMSHYDHVPPHEQQRLLATMTRRSQSEED